MKKLINKEFKILNHTISGKSVIAHPLFSGSAIMIFGSNIANVFAYLYHVIFGRILGPTSYGELAAIISMFGLIVVAFNYLGLVVVKFVSSSKGEHLQHIYSWFAKKVILLGLLLGILVLISTSFLAEFLHIEKNVIIVIAPTIFVTVLSFMFRAFLQGKLKFTQIALLSNSDVVGRLVFGLVFIYLGLEVFGAAIGLLAAAIVSLLLGRYFTREYKMFSKVNDFKRGPEVLSYAAPILVGTISINSFFTTDVLLVKHFFDSYQAGLYAALSFLGKIIYFGVAPISGVMFPMVSKRHSAGGPHKKIFWLSLLMVILIAASVLTIYYFIPGFAVRMLYGSRFVDVAPYLFQFGLFMALFSISSFFVNYFLSRNKNSVVLLTSLGSIVQALGIWYFHNDVLTVIRVSLLASAMLFASLLIYFSYDSAKEKNK
jgi:O-antigen/teichoic acid export membrane protein